MTTDSASPEAEEGGQGSEKRLSPRPMFELPLTAALRLSGASAGDLHGALVQEGLNAFAQAKGNALGTVKIGLARLQSDGLLTAREVRGLAHICGLVFAVVHKERDMAEVCPKVRDYYYELVASGDASPVALALASITMNVCTDTLIRGKPEGGTGQMKAAAAQGGGLSPAGGGADVGGGVAGAVGGAIIGGPVGAFFGAIIGGMSASIGAEVGNAKAD
jgi:hypothetical protein